MTDLVIVLPLLLLAGLLGVGIAVVVRGPDLVGHRALLEVQASLTGLHDHARRHPGRLEIGRVRREAVLAVRAAIEPDRVLLLDLGGVDGLSVTDLGIGERASFEAWSRGPSLAVAQRAAGVVSDHELLDMVGGGRLVLGAPMSVNGHARGLLMVAWDDEPGPARRRERCRRLEELADDAALAMENAELFEAINNLSATGERNRLARELHDGIIQSFVHVGFELERLARDVADLDVSTAMRIVDLRNVVGDAVSETRSVVSHLRRDEVSGEGLDGAVRRWLQASPATGGPTIRFTPEPMLLPPEVVPDLLRVTQQAVANARQHAHAATVRITTVARGADFVLVIEDDGRGSTATSARLGGVGLQSMAERLERLGGDLMVEPVDPTGTRVTATLPGILMIGAAA